MDKGVAAILARGIMKGYAGKSVRGFVNRADFALETSDYRGKEGKYHDEWAADLNGGGQELVESANGEKGTRVYAGGVLPLNKLQQLGLTKKDVIEKLVSFINKLGDKTRLDRDAEVLDGEWSYTYRVLKDVRGISVVLGQEEIRYKDKLVFVHFHIISSIL